jgi:hypothetical protein
MLESNMRNLRLGHHHSVDTVHQVLAMEESEGMATELPIDRTLTEVVTVEVTAVIATLLPLIHQVQAL